MLLVKDFFFDRYISPVQVICYFLHAENQFMKGRWTYRSFICICILTATYDSFKKQFLFPSCVLGITVGTLIEIWGQNLVQISRFCKMLHFFEKSITMMFFTFRAQQSKITVQKPFHSKNYLV